MLKEVSGDILLSTAGAIAHGIAPHDHFKQGLALSLREQWPGMYKDFRHYCQTYNPKPGGAWSWKGPSSPVIINLFTQEAPATEQDHPGKATLPNVNHALQALKKELQEHQVKSLALPRLATGVGGLEWETVYPLLQQALKELHIPVYVYGLYKKGVAAQEA
ncbi:MAG TPA: macro domain-containing protein [Nitrospira sp.]|nr:Appr-1-p processing protein [Nitrospira sp. NTP1]HQR13437.1 macro domain-containing protein [Nitrospira sp.]HQV12059.1 macro domain-containing protein [Nitrospira sp.]